MNGIEGTAGFIIIEIAIEVIGLVAGRTSSVARQYTSGFFVYVPCVVDFDPDPDPDPDSDPNSDSHEKKICKFSYIDGLNFWLFYRSF